MAQMQGDKIEVNVEDIDENVNDEENTPANALVGAQVQSSNREFSHNESVHNNEPPDANPP
ncbi:hypothetical protein RF55_20867, partial [Lasius niger]